MMKKRYEKPTLLCEELHPEEMLCACLALTPQFNEVSMCVYPVKISPHSTLTYNLFLDAWPNCDKSDARYCYQMGATNIFSS